MKRTALFALPTPHHLNPVRFSHGAVALHLAVAVILMAPNANADEAMEILRSVDATMAESSDQVATLTMVLEDAEGKTRERKLSMKQKGSKLRMMKFLSPAEVKGVGFLTLSDDEMYLYMPEFKKIRRIASHLKNDTFMGTDFSYGDMGSTDFSGRYNATLKKKDAAQAILELTPKKADDSPYGKLVVLVDLQRHLPLRVDYFDKQGQAWKVMDYAKVEKIGKRWVPRQISMRDLKKKHATRMEMTDIKFDNGLKDKDFSQRLLKRGR